MTELIYVLNNVTLVQQIYLLLMIQILFTEKHHPIMTQYVDYTNLHVSPRVNMPHLDMEGFIRRRSGLQTDQIDPA